jgi:cation transport ATPase
MKRSVKMARRHIVLPIDELGCWGSGALIIERALAQVPGVRHVYVNAATEMAYVQFDVDECVVADLEAAIARAGFHADSNASHADGQIGP